MSYYWCDDCQRGFREENDYHNHLRASPQHHWCQACNIDFDCQTALHQHIVNDIGHIQNVFDHVCTAHRLGFHSEEELEIHFAEQHYYCRTCEKFFPSDVKLKDHYVVKHHYCTACERLFGSSSRLKDHYVAKHDFCQECQILFSSKGNYESHMAKQHFYCNACDRFFQSASSISAHLQSSLHSGRNVQCPYGCEGFPTRSALALHLEMGTCKSGLNRRAIDTKIWGLDKNDIITNKKLDYHKEDIVFEAIANEGSWNGRGFQCYLCNKEYPKLVSLNQHLNSPAHSAKLYKCPGVACSAQFGQLSGLWQHLESEGCESGMKIRRQILQSVSSTLHNKGAKQEFAEATMCRGTARTIKSAF